MRTIKLAITFCSAGVRIVLCGHVLNTLSYHSQSNRITRRQRHLHHQHQCQALLLMCTCIFTAHSFKSNSFQRQHLFLLEVVHVWECERREVCNAYKWLQNNMFTLLHHLKCRGRYYFCYFPSLIPVVLPTRIHPSAFTFTQPRRPGGKNNMFILFCQLYLQDIFTSLWT